LADLPHISTKHLGGSLWLVQLEGEHDLSTASGLRQTIDRVFATGTCLVVDLSSAAFIDSRRAR
jgi:anti-anti-sigma regulatory factor